MVLSSALWKQLPPTYEVLNLTSDALEFSRSEIITKFILWLFFFFFFSGFSWLLSYLQPAVQRVHVYELQSNKIHSCHFTTA